MKIIKPIAMTDALLTSSNVAENDHGTWNGSTTYAAQDRVIDTAAHRIYESVQSSNFNHDPTTDDGTWWLEISATNRWKAFDGVLADQSTNSGTITYSITTDRLVTGVAFFNLSAAEIRVQVFDDTGAQVYDATRDLVDDSDIVDWFSFFTADLDQFKTLAMFADFTALPGYRIDITIGDGTGTAAVGEISLGKIVSLGETHEGTSIGLTSFSTKEQDSFGNWSIVSRAKSDPVNFTFSMKANDAARVKRVLDSLRDTAAVYFAHEDLVADYAAISFGLFQDYEIPLRKGGVSTVSLEIEGLT
jgi:hypothetical protein